MSLVWCALLAMGMLGARRWCRVAAKYLGTAGGCVGMSCLGGVLVHDSASGRIADDAHNPAHHDVFDPGQRNRVTATW
ncbi:MAG: hypothetical protein M3Q30_17050 [Actinomycetota bacterium]|nr:hypothetical protein [Actinomycetota bacterium]